jgi:type VI secretion system protein ImpH
MERLQSEPYKYNFYQLVRLLEMLRPSATSVGAGADPHREPVRFRSSFSLAFPPSDVVDLQTAEAGPDAAVGEEGPPEVTVSFLGLGGAHGPLPHQLTEWVLERNAVKDFALRDFLDIFNHRLVSLSYRVRRNSRLGMQWTSPEEHQFSSYLMSLLGMLTGGLQDRLAIPDRALLRYVGILTKHPRDATGLQTMLADFFRMPVRCLQLRGAMRSLDADQWTHLGMTGRNRTLGRDALLGTSIWDQQAGIEIELGPVPWASYLDFLPGQAGLRSLCQLVRFYIGPSFDVHVALLLQADQIPTARLCAPAAPAAAAAGAAAATGAAAAPVAGTTPAAAAKFGSTLGLTTFLSYGTPLQGHPRVQLGVIARYSDEPQRTGP